jgi:feruloyl esterase
MTYKVLGYNTRILVVVASLVSSAAASTKPASTCTAAAVQAAAPSGMTIIPITDGNTPAGITEQNLIDGGGVVLVPPNTKLGTPEFCFVQGTVVTNAATGKTANFQAALPTAWNGKFLFKGCMVLCGVADVPEVESVQHGYASASTDDGHIGNPALGGTFDGSWALNPDGTPNADAVTDYYYRAVHTVTQAGKKLAQGFYSQSVSRSYFKGCSDGGREAMVEVSRFPADFDGVIAGDPFFNMGGQVMDAYTVSKVQLGATDAAVVPASLLHILDKAVMAQCDSADGVQDGLIQDPALCNYNPKTKLPLCSGGKTTNCFTQDQADSVASWFTAITDASGGIAHQGYPLADTNDLVGPNLRGWAIPANNLPPLDITSAQPWGAETGAPGSWLFADNVLRYLIFRDANYNSNSGPGMTFNVLKEKIQNLLPDATIQTINKTTLPGRGDIPKNALPFLSEGRKLIMYHGFSDDIMTPYHTMMYYEALAKLEGGYPALQANARLFMVPGMFHCTGGPGPNVFDSLSALESWVESGIAPDAIPATGGAQLDQLGNPRSMPLCQFPEMASYNGTGDVNDAANWSCSPDDQRLLLIGPNGQQAGLH